MTTGGVAKERRLFRLSPVDKTGVFLGLSILQLLVAGCGAITGSIVMVFVSVPIGIGVAVLQDGETEKHAGLVDGCEAEQSAIVPGRGGH